MAPKTSIDLNSDLGEGYGTWRIGEDAAMLGIVSSANIACGGHAGDAETMFETLSLARAGGVTIGAHPGYADRPGFGRRIIPMTMAEIERMVASQIGALSGVAALAGASVRYVKTHGALANLAADEPGVATAIALATRAVGRDLALLAISGSELETAGSKCGLRVFSEVFADRAYLPTGRLVPRGYPDSMLHNPETAATRLLEFLACGRMPTLSGSAVPLRADSVCVHGDSPGALRMAKHIRTALSTKGIALTAFLSPA